ncbi:hypothetical protein PsorP6_007616 [Peronosclerospora sorghi]|uniref:Uncharacterized protein n=1 Tax=Peronosclerospora sorghi TaxID=230839 RepID=A0ACC0WAG9_9STRA|nr:hypothetical protein PsorP6_007616 [Peronosclerospora sorghi]
MEGAHERGTSGADGVDSRTQDQVLRAAAQVGSCNQGEEDNPERRNANRSLQSGRNGTGSSSRNKPLDAERLHALIEETNAQIRRYQREKDEDLQKQER